MANQKFKLQKEQACQLFIEQEIEDGLSKGKTKYAIGQELSKWIGKLFLVEVSPHTLEQQAHRAEAKLLTSVSNPTPQNNSVNSFIANQLQDTLDTEKVIEKKYSDNTREDVSYPSPHIHVAHWRIFSYGECL